MGYKNVFIDVLGVSYPVKFGFGAFRLLTEKWGFTKFSELDKNLSKLNFKAKQEPTVEQMGVFGDIVWCGVKNASKEELAFDYDDLMGVLLFNPDADKITEIMQLFSDSLPNNKKPGKQKKAKK